MHGVTCTGQQYDGPERSLHALKARSPLRRLFCSAPTQKDMQEMQAKSDASNEVKQRNSKTHKETSQVFKVVNVDDERHCIELDTVCGGLGSRPRKICMPFA